MNIRNEKENDRPTISFIQRGVFIGFTHQEHAVAFEYNHKTKSWESVDEFTTKAMDSIYEDWMKEFDEYFADQKANSEEWEV